MSICNLTVASSLATVRARSDTLTRRSRSAARSSASSVCGLKAPRCSRCARESCGACSMRAARARALRARAEAAIAISRGAACVSERLGARAHRWRSRGNAPARNAPARAGKLLGLRKKSTAGLRKKRRIPIARTRSCRPVVGRLVGWWVGWLGGWVVGWLERYAPDRIRIDSKPSQAKRSTTGRLGLCLGLMDRVESESLGSKAKTSQAEQSRAEQSSAELE